MCSQLLGQLLICFTYVCRSRNLFSSSKSAIIFSTFLFIIEQANWTDLGTLLALSSYSDSWISSKSSIVKPMSSVKNYYMYATSLIFFSASAFLICFNSSSYCVLIKNSGTFFVLVGDSSNYSSSKLSN